MFRELVKIANELDNRKLLKEADAVDYILIKIAGGRADLFGDLFGGLVRSGDEVLDMERAGAKYLDVMDDIPSGSARPGGSTDDIDDVIPSRSARPGGSTDNIDDVVGKGRAAADIAKADIVRAATNDMFIEGPAGAGSFLNHIQETYKRLGQDMSPAQQRAFLEEQVRASAYISEAAKADPNSVIKALAGEASTIARAPLGGPVTRLEIKDIISRPYLGKGSNGRVWAIPDSDLVIKVKNHIVERGIIDDYLNNKTFEAASDITGQLVGRIGDEIWILKKQQGIPAGARFRGRGVRLPEDVLEFKSKLLLQASMPQSSYDEMVEQLVDFNSKGILIDPSKAGNVLIDANGGSFNFIDLNPAPGPHVFNSGDEVLTMMVDGVNFRRMELYNDLEAVEAVTVISDKIRAATHNNPNFLTHDPRRHWEPQTAQEAMDNSWVTKLPEPEALAPVSKSVPDDDWGW